MIKPAFQRVLLATEHTEFDVGAERVAIAMAKQAGLPLHVVFPLLSNPEYEAEMPDFALHAEQAAADKITHLRNLAEKQGVQIDVHVRRGSERHREIVGEAADLNADLIIIRRRGKPGFFARMLIGDMVSRVIHDASCNVLMVPRKAELWSKGVLVAVGDTPDAASITKTAALIAQAGELPLTILSVAADQDSLTKAQSFNTLYVALVPGSSVDVRGEVRIGHLVEQSSAAVKETGADLVVIGRQRYHLNPFGNQSPMHNIAGNMNVATLVVSI